MSYNGASELVSDQVEVRRAAAERLAQTPLDPAALPLLVKAAGDQDEAVRQWVTAALEEAGKPPASSIGEITPLLDDSHDDVAYWAATLIGRLGPAGATAAAPLAELLRSGRSESVRERAAWALGCIGPPAEGALASLRETARLGSPRLARLAERAIAAIAAG